MRVDLPTSSTHESSACAAAAHPRAARAIGLAAATAIDVRVVIDRDDLDASLSLVDPVDDTKVTAPATGPPLEAERHRRGLVPEHLLDDLHIRLGRDGEVGCGAVASAG